MSEFGFRIDTWNSKIHFEYHSELQHTGYLGCAQGPAFFARNKSYYRQREAQ